LEGENYANGLYPSFEQRPKRRTPSERDAGPWNKGTNDLIDKKNGKDFHCPSYHTMKRLIRERDLIYIH
jgi:hypothetical protein